MKQLPPVDRRVQSKAYASTRAMTAFALALGVGGLSACAGVSDVTKERVSNSSVAVQQSEQTLGRSEDGAVELQRAKENLEAANKAVAKTDEQGAERYAALAQLHAELAVAQSQSAEAKRGAAEVLASTKALRQESERNAPVSR
jgi:Domain of unknown function (DUF4398)